MSDDNNDVFGGPSFDSSGVSDAPPASPAEFDRIARISEAVTHNVMKTKYGMSPHDDALAGVKARRAVQKQRPAQPESILSTQPAAKTPNWFQKPGPNGTVEWDWMKVGIAAVVAGFVGWKVYKLIKSKK